VGIVVTDCTVDFAKEFQPVPVGGTGAPCGTPRSPSLPSGSGGWLAVSTGKQRNVAVFHGERFHRVDDLTPVGRSDTSLRAVEHQRRQVVDIFRGTGEVNEL
jgi:hypothetical protein